MQKIDYATTFLLWSYFGISVEELSKNEDILQDKLIEAAIMRAYRDASSHVLSVKPDYKNTLKKQGIDEIKNYISKLHNAINTWSSKKDLTNEETQTRYDELHRGVCDQLVTIYDDENHYATPKYRFSYGIAQKWVNMSIKYIYIIYDLLEDTQSVLNIKLFTRDFHVPLDSYIFDALKSELGITNTTGKKWSKIDDYDTYLTLQKEIRAKVTDIFPIEWENTAWIRFANKSR